MASLSKSEENVARALRSIRALGWPGTLPPPCVALDPGSVPSY